MHAAPLQSIQKAERHPYFNKPLYKSVMHVVFMQLTLPADPAKGAYDPSDMAHFRGTSSSVSEVLQDCFRVLQDEYVMGLLQQVQQASVHLQALRLTSTTAMDVLSMWLSPTPPVLAASNTRTWQPLESALYCLLTLDDELSDLLEDAHLDASTMDNSVAEHVVALIRVCCLTVPPASMPPELVITVCRWLASLHRWLAVLEHSPAIQCANVLDAFAEGVRDTVHPGSACALSPGHAASCPPAPGASAVASTLDMSLTFVPPSQLMSEIISFLAAGMQLVHSVPAACHAPRPETFQHLVASIGIHSSGTPSSSVPGGAGMGGDSEEESGEEDWTSAGTSVAHFATVSSAAAFALARVCKSCRRMLTEAGMLKNVADALQSAAVAGMPTHQMAYVMKTMLPIATNLPSALSDAGLHYLLDGP
ncbi:MAG: hypothetical protein EOO41_03830, partial [Methanobacteriota archaeon]